MALNFSEYIRRFFGDAYFYSNANQVLFEVLVWLQKNCPRSSPNIILPSLMPEDTIQVISEAGFESRLYPVSVDFQPDIQEIESLVDTQTQAILFKHHFGIPAVSEQLKAYSEAGDIFLIEDCTQTIRSSANDKEAGTVGDCAIFNCKDILGLPEGGVLILNSQPWSFSFNDRRESSFNAAYELMRIRVKHMYDHLTRGMDPLSLACSNRDRQDDRGHKVAIRKISLLMDGYLQYTNISRIVDLRRENYNYLYNKIRNLPLVEPLPLDPEGAGMMYIHKNEWRLHQRITPASLPVLVPCGKQKLILSLLQAAGIRCPVQRLATVGQNEWLKKRLIELPIHQGINKHQLDRIVHCLTNIESVRQKEIQLSYQDSTKAEVV